VAEKTGRKNDRKIVKSNTYSVLLRKSLLFIVSVASVILVTRSTSYSLASSIILEVPYHDQITRYNCGPATIQMVLEYSNGMYLTQDQLEEELNTNPIEGVTFTYAMDEPFQSRKISKVSSGPTTLAQLKQKINDGYAPILLIWFDKNHETGHYVVAVGYNETGVFVNDPWPEEWESPEDRETGSYVYLTNEELKDLWSNYYQCSMTVPFTQPEGKSFKVEVELHGLPEDVQTTLYLNEKPIKTLRGEDETTILLIDEPDNHFIRVDVRTEGEDGVEYLCKQPGQLVGSPELIEFNYQPLRR
jgi:hypothetical protein